MNTRIAGISIGIALLLLIVGCSEVIDSTPISQGNSTSQHPSTNNLSPSLGNGSTNNLASKDPCSGVTCTSGKKCSNGVCSCVTGRDCNGVCIGAIGTGQCCATSECGINKRCSNNQCVEESCNYNQVKNSEGGCDCVQGTIRCLAQNKCIPTGRCCSNADCPGNSDAFCDPIDARAIMCTDNGGLFCKTMRKNIREDFDTFSATVIDIREAGMTITHVGNTTLRLLPGTRTTTGNATFFIKSIEPYGGTCKQEVGLVTSD